MERNIFFTSNSSLIVRQKQIFYAVIALFIFSQFAGILNYKIFENLLIFLGFVFVVLGIYISMNRSKLKVIHWLAVCFGVFIWAIIDAIRSVNEDLFLRSKEQISYLDFFDLLPMFLLLVAVGIFFINKIKALPKRKWKQILSDSFNVFLLVCILTYCMVGDIGYLKEFILSKNINNIVFSLAFFINLLILFITLSEIFTSTTFGLKYSGFYFIVGSVIFTLLNLYVFYNGFLFNDFKVRFHSLYLVPFIILMVGSFYLKGKNKDINMENVGVGFVSRLIPMTSACLLLIKGDIDATSDLLALVVIVIGAILGYYCRASNESDEAYEAERLLHDIKNKEKRNKMVELEIMNLSLENVSEKDYLTSFDNRDSLLNKLDEMCKAIEEEQEIVVYYINISRFKNINTSYGHGIGDKILKIVAKRIREACNRQEFIARIGADEFIVLSNMEENSHTKRMKFGLELRETIEKPMQVDKYHFYLKSIIGIYVVNRKNITEPRDIIKRADMAMYYAKNNPALNPMVYNKDIDRETYRNSAIEIALKGANLQEDFEIYFQPIVDMENQKISCAEALLRWHSKEFGLKEAGEFMEIASLNSEILNEICTLAVLKSIEQVVSWRQKGIKIPKISINVDQIQSTSEKFVSAFILALNSHHLNPKQFELEFSESIWQNDQETLDKIFSLLEKNSIDVCIDDFGSGYTSFVYIRKYKIDRIKIANDFVAQSVINKKDMQVVAAIINIAKSMKLKVTAKGVESHEIKELLKELNCNEMQGYFLSRPMSAEEFENSLRQNSHMVADI